ncbi:MAG: MBL fold metallo-hydrolase [Bacteroidaceae bacterium]|nr:MBL fold metallo-hydrolase [Bacteroidaceae bacterium]MBQ8270541.1 MBL fold metallo-hydrolase [Bacteroidaceae bacterium]
MITNVTENIKYIGVDDADIDLFESQYVVPNGISYNSYIILDEKVAIVDTVDLRKSSEWWSNLETALCGRTPDYLIVQHMEPDHAGNIAAVVEKYPDIRIVASERAVSMLSQFFEDVDFSERTIAVSESDTLELGGRTLQFVMAPMVHWPEVMLTYDSKDKLVFSADAFGKFGVLTHEEEWACEARRYYFNICGKYGNQVQALLKKLSTLDVATICPLHGPILSDNLGYYIGLYDTWSKYEPETDGVLVAYASIHGGTAAAAHRMVDILKTKGVENVIACDLSRCDMAEAVEDAFRMSKMILAASSYDANVFPPMYDFLHHLQMKGYRRRRVGIIENGSWAPTAGRVMNAMLAEMRDLEVISPVVTIRSRMKRSDLPAMELLADSVMA